MAQGHSTVFLVWEALMTDPHSHPKTYDPRLLALVSNLIEDGASLNEIYRTTGITRKVVQRRFGYRGWGKGFSERSLEAQKATLAFRGMRG